MRKGLVYLAFLILALMLPIGCSEGNGVGGGGEQNIAAVTGEMICFPVPACEPVYIVITATQFTAWTPTPTVTLSPTPTLTPTLTTTPRPNTPTPATPPVIIEITPITNPSVCNVEPFAARVKGTYTYKDYANYGIDQNIRTRPGTQYAWVGSLAKDTPRAVYWLKWVSATRWVALNQECSQWVSASVSLGILDLD